MPVVTLPFGSVADGRDAHIYLLSNGHGVRVGVTDVGACLVSAHVPDAHGNLIDVVLAHAGVRGYEHNPMGFGATVGRNANRIAGARFDLDGKECRLTANEGDNSLHSGPDLWFERLWNLVEAAGDHVTFSLRSADGDQGFPGEVVATATYSLSEDDRLTVTYGATTSEPTVINMTNHTYWNLDGHAAGTVLGHELQMHAASYLPVDSENIPTGDPASVEDTPFDLREGRRLEDVLADLPRGYDHNFCLGRDGDLEHVARLTAGRSGIVMDMHTDAPGLQVYMAGWLDDMVGKDGAAYGRFSGIALEPQRWPDTVHHPTWPSSVHSPDHPFSQTTVFAFSHAE